MRIITNAWFWFGIFCIVLFFGTIHIMGLLVAWAGASVPPEPDYSLSTVHVYQNKGEQLSAPTHFVQGSSNAIQPDLISN